MSAPRSAPGAHAPRPSDLVALVTFDDEVHENQAITRDRLARPAVAPHPLNAALEQWLGGRHPTWIDVRGRQIQGIATARRPGSGRAWMIDTLVDASAPGEQGVPAALLRQALAAGARQRVTHVLLRLAIDAPARPDALRAGFQPALGERLWSGGALAPCGGDRPGGRSLRAAREQDAFALFQLYNRALPIQRQALALTLEEWQAVQERRWLKRGAQHHVALDGDRICASLRLAPSGQAAQFDLIAEPGGLDGASALLDFAGEQLAGAERVLALIPRCAAPLERLLRERGLEEGAEYELLSRRAARPLAERKPVRSGIAVSTDA